MWRSRLHRVFCQLAGVHVRQQAHTKGLLMLGEVLADKPDDPMLWAQVYHSLELRYLQVPKYAIFWC